MKDGRFWLFWIVLFSGIILGGLLGELASSVSFLSWMSYGETFGLTQPLQLDIGIIQLSFGVIFKLNVASIIGVLIALLVYRKL